MPALNWDMPPASGFSGQLGLSYFLIVRHLLDVAVVDMPVPIEANFFILGLIR